MTSRLACAVLAAATFSASASFAAPVLLSQSRSVTAAVEGVEPSVAQSTEAERFLETVTSSNDGSTSEATQDSLILTAPQFVADMIFTTTAAADGPVARASSDFSSTFRLDTRHTYLLIFDFARLIGPGEDASYQGSFTGDGLNIQHEGDDVFDTSGVLEPGEYTLSLSASQSDSDASSRVRYGVELALTESPDPGPDPEPIPLPPAAWAGAMTLGGTWLIGTIRRRRRQPAR